MFRNRERSDGVVFAWRVDAWFACRLAGGWLDGWLAGWLAVGWQIDQLSVGIHFDLVAEHLGRRDAPPFWSRAVVLHSAGTDIDDDDCISPARPAIVSASQSQLASQPARASQPANQPASQTTRQQPQCLSPRTDVLVAYSAAVADTPLAVVRCHFSTTRLAACLSLPQSATRTLVSILLCSCAPPTAFTMGQVASALPIVNLFHEEFQEDVQGYHCFFTKRMHTPTRQLWDCLVVRDGRVGRRAENCGRFYLHPPCTTTPNNNSNMSSGCLSQPS